ncbi:endo-1,3-alpha-glucanase family glycosylhydrolase [Bradyrhizobium hipponense]|nr:endo-1,3-alpha-glucanase family glycosylhydrolase [Bradyrhizobium hipponense]
MVHDIRAAVAVGIDGFQFNIGSTKQDSYLYWLPLLDMLAACERLDVTFSIMLSLDCAVLARDLPITELADALASVAKRIPIARTPDGRLILGAFAPERWPVTRWRQLFAELAAKGEVVYFAPSFLNGSEAFPYLPLVDAASIWGGNRSSQFAAIESFALLIRAAGKGWIAPVWPQDVRPKDFWYVEAGNSRLFRQGWERAIAADADAVAIATWNDYSEGSEIQPSTSIQHAFYDLTAFFVGWYKERKQPSIAKDVLFYFHRVESTDAQAGGSLQTSRFTRRFDDPESNEIELLGFLTSAGRLEIETSKGIVNVDATGGITSLRAPLVLGRPTFRLVRSGKAEISFASAYEVRAESQYQDLLYHSGSSDRPAIASSD